jgi:hypothetical protein
MAAALMPLHVAAYAECFATSGVRAFVWLLARVAVGVNAQATRPRKRLVAGRTYVAILGLRE